MSSGNLLLHAVSARRDISWGNFKLLFDAFSLQEKHQDVNTAVDRSTVLRILDSLGHIETIETSAGRRIVAAPSALARLTTMEPTAVFTGSRSLESIDRLQEAAKDRGIHVEISEHGGHLSAVIPLRIAAHAATEDSLAEYAGCLGIQYQPRVTSWTLAQFTAGIEDALGLLRWETSGELTWPRADFDTARARFGRRDATRAAYRLTRYVDPIRSIRRYWLWNDLSWAEIDGDWGRYAALRDAGVSVLYFDRSSNLFGVPRSTPLPRLMARTMALCSGYAPCVPRKSPGNTAAGLDVYRFVPKAIADVIAVKLGQDACNCRIEL